MIVDYKKYFIYFCFSASIVYLLVQLNNTKSTASPQLHTESLVKNLVLDVGKIKSFDIQVVNKGGSDLKVYNISSSCGCLVPHEDVVIMPAFSEKSITLVFHDLNGPGKRMYHILADTNDSEKPIFKYSVIVNVTNEIQFSSKLSGEFTIAAEEVVGIDRCQIESSDKWFKIEYRILDGRVIGNIIPDISAPKGYYSGEITFLISVGNKKYTKNVVHSYYVKSNLFSTSRPFTLALFADKQLYVQILINGFDANKYNVEYKGSKLFSSAIAIKENNIIQLSLQSLQSRYRTTAKGHVLIKNRNTGEFIYSHPVLCKF